MRRERSEEKNYPCHQKNNKNFENERREIATQTRDYEIPPLKQ
jgi:hypothetical protein